MNKIKTSVKEFVKRNKQELIIIGGLTTVAVGWTAAAVVNVRAQQTVIRINPSEMLLMMITGEAEHFETEHGELSIAFVNHMQ